MIKKITVKTSATDAGTTYEVGQLDPAVSNYIYRKDDTEGSGLKDGNLEIISPESCKLNLVGNKESIQLKPGLDEVGSINALQLDCEAGTLTCEEFPIKVCNGLKAKATRVVGTKLNTAELVIDTQKADTTAFDPASFDIKFRNDKWNSGEVGTDGTGPIYAKMKARAIDFRCYDHGGIALQIAGQDGSNHENKIKFESDRTTALGTTASYLGEGGKGLEFGTFNNEHTSLYTGDYRFKGDAPVYAVSRSAVKMYDSDGNETEIATEAEKYDYPTQSDDFKDVIDYTKQATWNQIVSVAKAYANGEITGGGEGEGTDLSSYLTKTEASSTYATISSIPVIPSGLDTLCSYNTISTKNIYEAGVETERTASNNYQIDVTSLSHYEDVDGNFVDSTAEGATQAFANINLESKAKVKAKADAGVEFEAPYFGSACSISKKGKVGYGNFETDKLTTKDDVLAAIKNIKLQLTIDNKYEGSNADISGIESISVPVYDLIKLIDRVNELESRVSALEGNNE